MSIQPVPASIQRLNDPLTLDRCPARYLISQQQTQILQLIFRQLNADQLNSSREGCLQAFGRQNT